MISFPVFLLCIAILVDTYVAIAPIMCVNMHCELAIEISNLGASV